MSTQLSIITPDLYRTASKFERKYADQRMALFVRRLYEGRPVFRATTVWDAAKLAYTRAIVTKLFLAGPAFLLSLVLLGTGLFLVQAAGLLGFVLVVMWFVMCFQRSLVIARYFKNETNRPRGLF